MLRPEPVSELVEEPDEPVVLSVELLPLVPLVDELPVVSPVAAAPELLPGVVIVSDAPLLLMPEVLEPEELPVAGCSDVVVVVVTELLPDAAPEPRHLPLSALSGAAAPQGSATHSTWSR